ncbi:MAG: hypothetical protein Q8S21_02680 [Candidatus Paracaedibacteraceae bacterium]|nr:hypothetical protein [Candidatus Paracaedibacteraceae bacterium]
MDDLVNNFNKSVMTSSIVLHDFHKEKFGHKKWIEYCVELMSQYGLVPTHMGISAPSLKSEKMNAYEREFKKFDKIYSQSITSICVQAVRHGGTETPENDLFSCNFDIDLKRKRTTFVLTISDSVRLLSNDEIKKIISKLCEFFNPSYGYYYKRLATKGPRWYACGVPVGLELDDLEYAHIDMWGEKFRISNIYQIGDLRDIYRMNLVMDKHLNREIASNMTLRSFIESNPIHGKLEYIDDKRCIWLIEDENTTVIRDVIKSSGVIIAG